MKKFGTFRLILILIVFVPLVAIFQDELFGLIFSGVIILAVLYWIGTRLGNKGKRKPEEMPIMTKEKEDRYEQLGMTPSEIELFRSTMNVAKGQIDRVQRNTAQSSKLKAIDLRHDTVKAAKALFKELVKEPTRLHDASHFLYTHLPNMADLTDKYLEINQHEVKSKEAFAKLEESAQVIDQLSLLIVQDYQQFVADDLEELDVEISIAKQSLNRDNKLKSELK
ncbi:5-bromo-4-chloroindolyl phosphate hydrolysis family protein [Enterococcus sp. LJL120]